MSPSSMAAVHERREFMDCGDDLELLQHKVGVGNYRLDVWQYWYWWSHH